MLNFLFGWLKSKPIQEPSLDQATTDIHKLKSKMDDIFWYLRESHSSVLPEQSQLFMGNCEFALTSLISCLSMAKDAERNELLKSKVKEIQDEQV